MKFRKITEVGNSDGTEETTINNVVENVAEKLTERQRIIIQIIAHGVAQNVAVNTKCLAQILKITRKTIQRDTANLQERRLIHWAGSDKTGHWKIIKDAHGCI